MQLRKQLWYSFFTIVSLPICLCQRSSAKQDAKITHFMALRLSETKTAFFFFSKWYSASCNSSVF